MIKTWLLRIIVGFLLLVIGLVITAPAKLLPGFIPNNTGLQLQGVSGRLLSGKAVQASFKGISIQQLAWDLSLTSLLSGKIGSDVSINDPAFDGNLFLEKGLSFGLNVSDINATQTVSALTEYWKPLKLVYPEGSLDWKDVSLSMDDKAFYQCSGSIKWINASLTVNNNLISLGTVTIDVSDKDGILVLTISDQGSPLDVKGTIRFGVDKRYHLMLSMTENLPSNIKNSMLMVTRPDGKGRLRINTKGRL